MFQQNQNLKYRIIRIFQQIQNFGSASMDHNTADSSSILETADLAKKWRRCCPRRWWAGSLKKKLDHTNDEVHCCWARAGRLFCVLTECWHLAHCAFSHLVGHRKCILLVACAMTRQMKFQFKRTNTTDKWKNCCRSTEKNKHLRMYSFASWFYIHKHKESEAWQIFIIRSSDFLSNVN